MGGLPLRHDFIRRALLAAALLAMPAAGLADPVPADRADASLARPETEDRRAAPPREPDPVETSHARTAAAASADAVLARSIRVEGATLLPAAAFEPALRPYLGRPLAADDLRRLATAVAGILRRSGYGLATAWVPQQAVRDGILVVEVDEGRIDAVEAEGTAAASVGRMLAPLADGRPVRTAELERRLLLAGDGAGVTVARSRIERRDGRNILRVETRRDRAEGRATIDNWGSGPVGPVRARLELNFNGILADDDRISLGGVMTPLQPGEFQFVSLGYARAVGTGGTRISVDGYYARSKPGATLSGRDIEGRSVEAEAAISHPFLRSREASLWGNLKLSLRDSDLERAGVATRADRIATLNAGVNGLAKAGGGWLRARLALVQGLDAFGATAAGDPLASRADGSAQFTKIDFFSQFTRPLGKGLSLQLGLEGQLASRPLLASEEMGLGGRSFLRGYDYREASGDDGVAASGELRFDLSGLPRALRKVQAYGYADAGKVSNQGAGLGGGTLASAGGGVRLSLKNGIEASAELGVPLKASPFDADPRPRFSFTLGARF
jgi:hemolysin activation/secretion protein